MTHITPYSFWDRLSNFLHKFTWIVLSFISWTNWVNSGKCMDNCWISCQVMADMNKVYDDLIIINLYCIEDEEVCVDRGGGHACTMPATARAPIRPGLPPCRRPIALIKWPLRAKSSPGFFPNYRRHRRPVLYVLRYYLCTWISPKKLAHLYTKHSICHIFYKVIFSLDIIQLQR